MSCDLNSALKRTFCNIFIILVEMGNSLTKAYGVDAERPRPRRKPSRRPTNRTYSPPPRGGRSRSPFQPARRIASDADDERLHRPRRKTTALAETDGNARRATGKARHTGHKRRHHETRPGRVPSRERRASPHTHRTRQAERQRPSRRTSAPPTSRVSRAKAGHDGHFKGSRHESSLQKGKTPVYVETIELEERGPRKECMICTESRPVRRFPSRPPTNQCTHEVSTCRRCLRKWIGSSFQTKLWDQITCPECGVRLGHADVRVCASSAIFQRYDELATRAALESIQGFRWCIAKGCKSGQVHEQGTAMPRFTCLACNASHCVVHGVPWHQGETCAEYDYR